MTQYAETLKAIMEAALKPDVERFVGFLADDVEYHFHVSTPPVRGKDGVRRFMAKYGTIAADPLWRVDRTAEAGNCLFVEGYEEYTDKRTGEKVRLGTGDHGASVTTLVGDDVYWGNWGHGGDDGGVERVPRRGGPRERIRI